MIDKDVKEFYRMAKTESMRGGDYRHRLRNTIHYKVLAQKYSNLEDVINAAANSCDALTVFQNRLGHELREYYQHHTYRHADDRLVWDEGARTVLQSFLARKDTEPLLARLKEEFTADALLYEARAVAEAVLTEAKREDIARTLRDRRGPMHLPWYRWEARKAFPNITEPEDHPIVRYIPYDYEGWAYVDREAAF